MAAKIAYSPQVLGPSPLLHSLGARLLNNFRTNIYKYQTPSNLDLGACMVSELIRKVEGKVLTNNGSHYLLLDVGMKEIFEGELKESFDPEKHRIVTTISRNSRGQIFGAYWIERR